MLLAVLKSVRMLKCLPRKYLRKCSTADTIARISFWWQESHYCDFSFFRALEKHASNGIWGCISDEERVFLSSKCILCRAFTTSCRFHRVSQVSQRIGDFHQAGEITNEVNLSQEAFEFLLSLGSLHVFDFFDSAVSETYSYSITRNQKSNEFDFYGLLHFLTIISCTFFLFCSGSR